MNILYIAYCTPYDGVCHAGGQTFNYYSKSIALKNKVSIVSYTTEEEISKVDLENYGIDFYPIIRPKGIISLGGKILSLNSKINPFYKYTNLMARYSIKLLINKLQKLKDNGYEPNVIVLEWTQIVVLIELIKKVFPNSKYVASEHDVTYIASYRKYKLETNLLFRIYKKFQVNNMFKREMDALNKFDYIFIHSNKELNILTKYINNENLDMLVPYYNRSNTLYSCKCNDILFYGNMSRKENYLTAIWFIKYVMPKLKDIQVRFVIVGSGIGDNLRNYENEKIIMKGFVKSIDDIFSKSLCFVAPLVLGAGIKVKVIEALYTGITVITNEIGIESIPAQDKKDFYLCKEADDYSKIIHALYYKKIPKLNGRSCIENNFSLELSFDNYSKKIIGLGGSI